MSEQVKKSITLRYGVFAVVLVAVLLIGILCGVVFGVVALLRIADEASSAAGQPALSLRAWMGLTYVPLTPASARSYNAPVTTGAFVVGVTPRSPAAKAGVSEGDIITSVDGRAIDDSTSVMDAIKDKKPNDVVKVIVLRNGSEQALDVTLGRSPARPPTAERSLLERLRRGISRIFGGD